MKNSKSMIMVLGLLALMFFGYMMFFTAEDEIPVDMGTDGSVSNAGEDLIALLEQLKSISLDQSLFASASFRALQDKTRPVEDEPVGRNNPFAPVGADGSFVPVSIMIPSNATSTR